MSEHVLFTQQERKKRLFSWLDRLTAVICSLVMTISLVTPSFIYAADLDPELSILDFEGVNPIASISIQENEKVEDSLLPDKIAAVVSLEEITDGSEGEEVDPDAFVMEQPDTIPSDYEPVEEGLYRVSTLNTTYPYRVYGRLGDQTGWFSRDEKTGQVNGRVEMVDLDWNLDKLNSSEPGKQILTASVLDAVLPKTCPQVEITVEPLEDEMDDAKIEANQEEEFAESEEDRAGFEDPADDRFKDEPGQEDQTSSDDLNQDGTTLTTEHPDSETNPDADSSAQPADDADGAMDPDQTLLDEPDAIVYDGSNGLEPSDGATLVCNNHSLRWQHGSDVSTIDGNVLTNATTINGLGTGQLTAHLVFSFSGSSAIESGGIKITLPYHVLKNRQGNWADTLSLPFPKQGEGTSTTGFVYEVDETNNQVIITNTEPFRSGSFLEADLTYSFVPYAVANGTKTSDIQALFEIFDPDSEEVKLTETSEPLQAVIQTALKDPANIKKSAQTTRRTWNPQWGEEPKDADQYIYTTWLVAATLDMGTQPFTTYVSDQPSHQGEIIGWYQPDREPSSKTFVAGNGDDLQKTPLTTMDETSVANGQSQHSVAIVVKTPIDQLTDKEKVQNEAVIHLQGVDGDEKKASVEGSFDYQKVDYHYSGDEIGVNKTGIGGAHGALQLLQSGQDYEPWDGANNVQPFELTLVSRGYGLSAEGTRDYTSYMDDYLLFLGNTRLHPGDYEYTAFTPSSYLQYEVFKDPNVGLTGKPDENYAGYAPIEVYITTGDGQDNASWSHYGTLTYPAAKTFKWNGQSVGVNEKIALPKGTTGVSFRQTGKQFQVDLEMKLYYKLIASKRVQSLATGMIGVYNVNSGYQGLPGQSPKPPTKTSGEIDASIKDQVAQFDQDRFGAPVAHASGCQLLMGFYALTLANKYFQGAYNNASESRFEVHYELNEFDTLVAEGEVTKEFAMDHGLITEQTEGTFYDLLPPGTTVDFKSIKAFGTDHQTVYAHTVELLPNWQGSGRTMMVVHVKKPADATNIVDAGSNTNTGMILDYTIFDPWENVLDNGKVLTNSYAYVSKDGRLYTGTRVIQDAPGQKSDQRYFTKLPTEGDPNVNNKTYASVTNNLSADIAAIYGFSTEVRTITDPDFAKETKTFGGQEYMYKLRFSANTTQTTGNVVMYDFLENTPGKTNDWQGTFKSIDVSQLTDQGAAPVVYYTTRTDLKPKADQGGDTLFDLANDQVWSTTPPSDLSSVTGVAVDVSKMQDGSPFVFDKGKSGVVMIYMEAPDNGKTGIAYNNAFMRETQTGHTQNEVETSNETTIQMDAQPIGLKKSSNPASGTKEAPTALTSGSELTYYLDIQNEDELAIASNIEVSDAFDPALTLDSSKIECTLYGDDTDTTGTPANDQVQITVSGQNLTVLIPMLAPEARMHIAIPTQIRADFTIPEGQNGVLLKNQAVLEKVGKIALNIPSAPTYHQITRPKPIQAPVVMTKKLEAAKESAAGTRALQADQFQFQLLQNDQVIETAQNDADGKIVFDDLTFNEEGTYSYTVQEVDDKQPGILYDTKAYPIEFVVTKTNGKLNAKMTAAQGTTITNQYVIAPAHVHVVFHKDLVPTPDSGTVALQDQKQLQDKQFQFQLVQKSTDPDGTTKNTVIETVSNDVKGQIAFKLLSFSKPGTYQYFVQEVNDKAAGIVYDESKYPVTITVQQEGNSLTAKVKTTMGTKLTNQYIVPPKPASAQIVFHKELSLASGSAQGSRSLQDNDFQFNLLQNGKVIQTTYNDAQGTITFGALTFTKEGTYTYEVQEVKDGLKNITYNDQVYPVEIVVTKDDDNQLQAKIKMPKGDTITNQYSVAPAAARIVFHKVLTSADGSGSTAIDVPPLADGQFTFQLIKQQANADGTTKNIVVDTVSNDAKGQVAFKPLKFDKAGEYSYVVQEVNNQLPGIRYDQTQYPVLVTVKQNEAALTAHVQTEKGTTITNQYQPAKAQIVFHKELALTPGSVPETRTVKADEFQFQLLQQDKVVETVTNDAKGNITFSPLAFTKPGTYTYTVKEVDTGEKGMVYDATSYPVQITVSKDGEKLNAAIETAQGDTITNHYGTPPTPTTARIVFTKVLAAEKTSDAQSPKHQPLKDGQFTFNLIETKDANNPATEDSILDTASNDANGQIAFKPLTFDQPGVYTYVVQEINDHAPGVIYDQKQYPVTITVKENGPALEASIQAEQGTTITNQFKPAKAQIVFQKKLELTPGSVPETRTIKANEFQFQLLQEDQVIETVHNDAEGTISFSPLEFTQAGTYTYTVKEVDEGKQGIVYDQTAYPVEITIDKNGEQLTAAIKTAQGNLITNHYGTPPTPATAKLVFHKTLTIADEAKTALLQNKLQLQAKQFDFQLAEIKKAADGTTQKTVIDTVSNDANGQIAFNTLTFKQPGTYQYVVREVDPDVPGMAYDKTQYPVTIVVTENGSVLEAEVQTDKGTTIANQYQPATASIVFHKVLEKAEGSAKGSRALQANDYQFSLLKDGKAIETAYNEADGTVAFGPLSFTKPGTYTYSVQEVKDGLKGITYDETMYPVEIKVTAQAGKLNAAISTPQGSTITNQYSITPAHARIVFDKALIMPENLAREALPEDPQLQDGQFQFQLFKGPVPAAATEAIPSREAAPAANDDPTLVEIVSNDAEGQIAFTPLTFDEVGTYLYYIQEVKGDTEGIDYDNTKYPVKIVVSKNGNVLEAKVTAAEGMTITNQYKPASAQITFHKQLALLPGSVPETRTVKADEFQFNLLQDGDVIDTARNDAQGNIAFDPLQFTETGTYTYTVQEVNTNEKEIVYDSKEYPVTITVSKAEAGLNAVVTTDQGNTITNHYGTPPTPATARILFNKVLMAQKTAGNPSSSDIQPLEDGQFTFKLAKQQTDSNGTKEEQVIDTASNDAKGQIAFKPLTFTKPGTYQYFVQEVNSHTPGIVYDQAKYPVTITVTENGAALEADIKTDQGTTITNAFKPAKAQIVFQKELALTPGSAPETRTVKANEFQFQLLQNDKVIETVHNDANGTITFSPLSFTKEGTYDYTVQEVDEGVQGIVYDKTAYPVKIVVTKNGEKFTADIHTAKGKTITNHYGTPPKPAHVNLVFQKVLTVDKDAQSLLQNHPEIRDKQFHFQLMKVQKDADGNVTSKQPVEIVANDASGKIAFGPLTFSKPGTYFYSVHEINDLKPGIAYDQDEYPIAIVVSEEGASLKAEVQTPQGTTFTNKFVAASAYIVFHKDLQLAEGSAKGARQLQDNEFQFNLLQGGKPVETAYNDADGTIAFGPLSFIEKGEYAYTVQEVKDGDPGITYDENEYPVNIVVSADGNDLKTTIDTPQGDTITNQYSISPAKARIVFHKELAAKPGTGYDALEPGQTLPQLQDQQFEFQLVEQKTKPDGTIADQVIETVRNDAKGQIAFSPLHFEEAGTYEYFVQEAGKETSGMIYDKTKYPVVITVKENDQALEASIQTDQGKTITNQYILPPKPAKAQIVFHKELAPAQGSAQGERTLQENDYQFNLLQADKVIETAFNQADGTITFGPLTFTKEGTYTYTVQEVKDGLEGITYNDQAYSVNIEVTKKGNELKADIQTPQGDTITNQYSITPAQAQIVFQKRFVDQPGSENKADEEQPQLQDGQFQFQLVEKQKKADGTTKDAVIDTAANDAKGQIVFKKLTFNQAGTYQYFQFQLVEKQKKADGTTKDAVIDTAANDAKGQIVFKKLTFNQAGTYQYFVQEINTHQPNVVYDDTQYPVTITIKRVGQALVASMKTEQGTILTNQAVRPPKLATAKIVFNKKLVFQQKPGSLDQEFEQPLRDQQFQFQLIEQKTNADGSKENKVIETVRNDANGQIVFTPLQFTKAGTYQYFVQEVNDRNPDIAYDETQYPVTVVVKENGQTLDAKVQTSQKAGTYQYFVQEVNDRNPDIAYDETQYPVTVVVKENGQTLDAKVQTSQNTTITNYYKTPSMTAQVEFEVDLKKADDAPADTPTRTRQLHEFVFELRDAQNNVLARTANDQDGKVCFANVPVDPNGERIYTIRQIDQKEDGITYDFTTRHAVVYAAANKAKSQAAVDYPEGQVFTNTYSSAESEHPRTNRVQISGQKTLTGKALTDGQFQFVLRGEGLELQASNGSDGKFYFLLPIYDQPGNHVYTIEEVNDGQSNITYDSTKYQAKVVVMKNGEGELESHLILQKMNADGTVDAQYQSQAAFTNAYRWPSNPPDDNPSGPDHPSNPSKPSNPNNSGKNNGANNTNTNQNNGSNTQQVSPGQDQTKNTNPINNTLNWTFNWPTIPSGQSQSTKSTQNGSNKSSVKTASRTDAMMWFVLWILALAAMILLPVYNRRQKSQK